MHIAILDANTDTSVFAQHHETDVIRFSRLLYESRPSWRYSGFKVSQDVFPDDYSEFDGVIVTGSIASANDTFPWIEQLKSDIRALREMKKPLFGACFGHQVISSALGGTVGKNNFGWAAGFVETRPVEHLPWDSPCGKDENSSTLGLYACHQEQVLKAPQEAQIILEADGVPVGGCLIGDSVFTVQYHPEMDDFFMRALMEEFAPSFGEGMLEKSLASLSQKAERARIAEKIAGFFEYASAKAASK